MTAIITKQNAKDKAFVGGGGDGSTDGLFNSLHVLGDTTLDGAVTITTNNKTINDFITETESGISHLDDVIDIHSDRLLACEGKFSAIDTKIVTLQGECTYNAQEILNHDERITKLEEDSHEPEVTNFTFEEGVNEYVIDENSLVYTDIQKELKIANTPTLPISYNGNVFKYEFEYYTYKPSIVYTTYNGLTKKYTNPKYIALTDNEQNNIEYYESDYPAITFAESLGIDPKFLYLDGVLWITWEVKPNTLQTLDKSIIKAPLIESDNSFQLYRSIVPDFYMPREYGQFEEIQTNPAAPKFKLSYFDYGYEVGSDEFNKVVDGQHFTFTDNGFGTTFYLTKQHDGWNGNNVCYHCEKFEWDDPSKYSTYFTNKYQYCQYYLKQCDAIYNYLNIGLGYNGRYNTETYEMDGDPVTVLANKIKDEHLYKCFNTIYKDIEYEITEILISYSLTRGYFTIMFKINIDNENPFAFQLEGLDYGDSITEMPIYMKDGNDYAYYPTDGVYYNTFNKVKCHVSRKVGSGSVVKSNLCHTSLKLHTLSQVGDSIEASDVYKRLRIYIPTNGMVSKEENDFDEENDNPIEYLYENADYDVTPKPERCSTLLTNYNIKTTGIVIGENLMSHVFALNTMGNNVIHIESQIVVIQSRMQEMQEQIDKISAEMGWWQLGRSVMETIINVAGGSVMKWVGSGLKIAASGIQNVLKVSFSKNVVEMEDIFIEGIINAGEVLASELLVLKVKMTQNINMS